MLVRPFCVLIMLREFRTFYFSLQMMRKLKKEQFWMLRETRNEYEIDSIEFNTETESTIHWMQQKF